MGLVTQRAGTFRRMLHKPGTNDRMSQLRGTRGLMIQIQNA